MAKRMINSEVVFGDAMIGVSNDSKALYIYLNMLCNDDGITHQSKVAMMASKTGIEQLEELKNSGLVLELENGAIAITDWFINNIIVGKNYNNPAKGSAIRELRVSSEGRYVFTDDADEGCKPISQYREDRVDNNPRVKALKKETFKMKPFIIKSNDKYGYYNNVSLEKEDVELLNRKLGDQADTYINSFSKYIKETGDIIKDPVEAIMKLSEEPNLEMLTAIDISNLLTPSFEEVIASARHTC